MKSRSRSLLVISTLVLTMFMARMASARGPSTQEERDTAVALIHLLETDPLMKQAKDARAWLTVWIIEIPDISVSVCGDLLGPGLDVHKKFAPELVVQQIYSMAAFVIEHPDQNGDKLAANTAAIAGVLKAYRALREKNPKIHFQGLDGLLKAESDGQLSAQVAEGLKSCK